MDELEKLKRMVERFRAIFPAGTRVAVTKIAEEVTAWGTIVAMDDTGIIHCTFDDDAFVSRDVWPEDVREILDAARTTEPVKEIML